MLTEVESEREAFEEQERMRQHVRDYASSKTRREVIRQHKAEFLDGAAQKRFERVLADCDKDADKIACEAAEEASGHATRTEFSVAAYEAAYVEAYADALPVLVATALAYSDVLRLIRLES